MPHSIYYSVTILLLGSIYNNFKLRTFFFPIHCIYEVKNKFCLDTWLARQNFLVLQVYPSTQFFYYNFICLL